MYLQALTGCTTSVNDDIFPTWSFLGLIWQSFNHLVQHEAFLFVGKPDHSLVVVLCPGCPEWRINKKVKINNFTLLLLLFASFCLLKIKIVMLVVEDWGRTFFIDPSKSINDKNVDIFQKENDQWPNRFNKVILKKDKSYQWWMFTWSYFPERKSLVAPPAKLPVGER